MEIPILIDLEEIVQRGINILQANGSNLTDFNEGSEIRNLLTAEGMTEYEIRYLIDYLIRQGYPQTAEGVFLDFLASGVGLQRDPGVAAYGAVTATLSEALLGTVEFTAGDIFTCSGDPSIFFEVTTDDTIEIGDTTVTLAVRCAEVGTAGNVLEGAIDTHDYEIPELSITNEEAFDTGTEAETDDELRERILDAWKVRNVGTTPWYTVTYEAVEGVHDIAVIENPVEDVDVGVYVNGETKPTPGDVITAVEDLLDDEDHKIPGIISHAYSPDFTAQDVTATVVIKDGYTWLVVKSELEADITCYFNGGITSYGVAYEGLKIGDDIIKSTILAIILNHEAVQDVTLDVPAANVTILVDGAGRVGTITLTEGV